MLQTNLMNKQNINRVEMIMLLIEYPLILQYKRWTHIKIQNFKTKIRLEEF